MRANKIARLPIAGQFIQAAARQAVNARRLRARHSAFPTPRSRVSGTVLWQLAPLPVVGLISATVFGGKSSLQLHPGLYVFVLFSSKLSTGALRRVSFVRNWVGEGGNGMRCHQ